MNEKSKQKQQAEFTKWMGPLLNCLRELGGFGKPREVSDKIAKMLAIPDSILEETLKSGASRFHNQVAWARQYLVWEGLLESTKRGVWSLTEKGKKTKLSQDESRALFLKWVDIHQKMRAGTAKSEIIIEHETESPDAIEENYSSDLITTLRGLSAKGFEQICGLLLRESGFDDVNVTGRSNDGGIDGYGTLELNPFVSIKVLFQCKKYTGHKVTREDVANFRNAMIGRAEKGILLTTDYFTSSAMEEASRDGAPKIELVDAEKLVKMFEKVELGLTPKMTYEVNVSFFEPFRTAK